MKYSLSIFIGIFLIISCSPSKNKENEPIPQVPEAEIFTMSDDVSAISFLPENYMQFAYFHDASNTYDKFITNELYTNLKDNYLFLDFKYNFAENRDMFFTKFNFDFESVFNYIEKDALLGITNNSFFFVASISFQSKIITSLLNIAPKSIINKTKDGAYTIYHIEKGSGSIYYSVINEYIIFADSRETLLSNIKAAEQGLNSDRAYLERVNDNELLYVKKVNSQNNPFDIFPVLSEIEILYNTESENISYVGIPEEREIEYIPELDSKAYETLKYLDETLPLVLYNSNYDFKSILKRLAATNNSATLLSNTQKIDDQLNGVYFVMKDLSPLLTNNSPDLGFVMNINSIEEVGSAANDLTSELLGIQWNKGTESESAVLYNSDNSGFYLITSNKNIALFTSEKLALDYLNRIENSQYSLYDLHFKSLSEDISTLNSFLCFNPETINSSLEGLLEKYLFSSINMDEWEYEKSFGGMLKYLSEIDSGYMDFIYDSENKKFYGSVKQIP